MHGCISRFATKNPVVSGAVLDGLGEFVDNWCRKHLKPLQVSEILSFEQWLETTDYPAYRKDELKKVHREMGGNVPSVKNKSFCKRETYGCYKPARAINSRSDQFKCYSGRYFHAIEEKLFALPSFIKKVPVKDRPQYLDKMFAGKVGPFYQTDYSHFESHFVPRVMAALELRLYKYMLQNMPDVATFLCDTLAGVNFCQFKRFSLSINGVRMSGDMCTSLGNGFSNLMLMNYVVFRKKGNEPEGVVEGDDGLFSVDVELTTKDFSDVGFDIKIVVYMSWKDASFCGMLMSDDLCHLVDPRKFFLNIGWTHSSLMFGGQNIRKGLMRAKAFSAVYENPRCPLVTSFARRILELTEGSQPRFETQWYKRQLVREATVFSEETQMELDKGISQVAREDYARLFGVPPSLQLYYEQVFHVWDWTSRLTLVCCIGGMSMMMRKIIGVGLLRRLTHLQLGYDIAGWPKIALSVLNRMPRDCTEPENVMMNSPETPAVSNTEVYSKTRESMEAKVGKRKQVKNGNANGAPRKQRRRRPNRANRVGMAPVAVAVPIQTGVGTRAGANAIVVRHREYVASVTSSVLYSCSSVSLNPGLGATFPWLSLVACAYEKYRFRQLRFIYKPQCGSSSSGSFWMAIDTDASDPTPSSKAVIASYANAAMGSIWSPLSVQYPIKNIDNMKQWYTRPGLVPNTDVKMYDVGNLYFATEGAAGAAVVGDIFVEYTVELLVPQLVNPVVSSSANLATTGSTLAQPLLNYANSVINSTVTVDNATDPTSSRIVFSKPGTYLLTGQNYGFTGITSGPDLTGSTATVSLIDSIWNAAQTAGQFALIVTVGAALQYVKMTMTGKAASAANCNVIIGGYGTAV